MIFVTVGTQKFQFNRILQAVDHLIELEIVDVKEVFAQIGHSDYIPTFRHTTFVSLREFEENLRKADLILTHGGTGSIIQALKTDKIVVSMPRRKEFGEHVDNHQIEIVTLFSEAGHIIRCDGVEDLSDIYLNKLKSFTPVKYPLGSGRITQILDEFILRSFLQKSKDIPR